MLAQKQQRQRRLRVDKLVIGKITALNGFRRGIV